MMRPNLCMGVTSRHQHRTWTFCSCASTGGATPQHWASRCTAASKRSSGGAAPPYAGGRAAPPPPPLPLPSGSGFTGRAGGDQLRRRCQCCGGGCTGAWPLPLRGTLLLGSLLSWLLRGVLPSPPPEPDLPDSLSRLELRCSGLGLRRRLLPALPPRRAGLPRDLPDLPPRGLPSPRLSLRPRSAKAAPSRPPAVALAGNGGGIGGSMLLGMPLGGGGPGRGHGCPAGNGRAAAGGCAAGGTVRTGGGPVPALAAAAGAAAAGDCEATGAPASGRLGAASAGAEVVLNSDVLSNWPACFRDRPCM